jgi:uncharacterized RDD family membrane protein YckC
VSDDLNHYEVLGVEPSATKEEIRAAYQERLDSSQQVQAREHAAKRPNESAVASARAEEAGLRSAWQVLSDPYQRGRYDASIDVPETPSGDSGEVELVDDSSDNGQTTQQSTRMTRRQQLDANRPPVVTLDGTPLELAETGRRATAAAIDTVSMIAIYLAVVTILGAVTNFKADSGPAFAVTTGTLFATVIAWLVIPTAIGGQTLGKRFTKIQMVSRNTGHLAQPSKVMMHYLPAIACLLILPGFGAPLALMIGLSFMMTRDGLSLGDKAAKTVVVIARYKPQRVGT